jgi:hypothetical protein
VEDEPGLPEAEGPDWVEEEEPQERECEIWLPSPSPSLDLFDLVSVWGFRGFAFSEQVVYGNA